MAGRKPVRLGIVGCGGMARHHLNNILQQRETTRITAICEPSPQNYAAAADIFRAADLTPPPNQPDFTRFLQDFAGQLDAVFIITPHVYHHDQTVACLEAGWDVLLEKPMVMNAAEARSLIEARDRTGKLLVVAFPGSLSPQIRTAVHMLRSGEIGSILNINAMVWQNWKSGTTGTWRQQPRISGGGFLFDTGAHMLNTVTDLAGEDFVEVAAWMDNRGAPVDILSVVIGKLKSGALVTLNACGEAIPSCHSDIRVFCTKGILRTGIWGEMLEIQRSGEESLGTMEVAASSGVWEQFLAVRANKLTNPGPPEIGLRMALLWDAIQASAAQRSAPVQCS
jgi:predicted dehydrogenase